MSTTVSGRSDDLIEFNGDLSDEVGWYSEQDVDIVFSDGTRLTTHYDRQGVWRFVMRLRGALLDHITPCPDATGETVYTDHVHFKSGLAWAQVGTKPKVIARTHHEVPCPHCDGDGFVIAPK